ncbi:putative MFS family arabinose efflux permease [Streptomyces sp. SAI-135]|uniref:MFS transporter n=1 Tax=unclassified Streptomyces TaxID=2593676 RepID=UPI002473D884|nr:MULTISPECIES: MFS transporter [unclassified Streptomyces]MDH6521582.1 putative MFS family arabinose efflux permease [Streptomyces sp. SAI-090]MDH6614319.1 putative MFS family arabinose efflux permease [Streptomyces sp. SAI-135]
MTAPVEATAPPRPASGGPLAGARRVTATVFAAQGVAVAAVSTTVPAVESRLGLSPLAMTTLTLALTLAAGAGSFAGLAAVRRSGPVAVMRAAVLTAAASLLAVAWAPGRTTAAAAYVTFGLALGAIDVSVNTRAATVERHYGRSILSSFYAAWSAAGVAAALLTAGVSRLGRPVPYVLTAHAVLVALLALTVRPHALAPPPSSSGDRPAPDEESPGRRVWARLVPFGVVLLVAYVVDSTVSAWSTAYLHQTLAASLAAAPLAYAAYQVGTVTGRAGADLMVRRVGPVVVVRVAALLAAVALAGLTVAPSWPYAVGAACCAGLGVAALTPLCVAAAGRLRPDAPETVLARLNVFNYVGVLVGAGASGGLGATGHFRIAYAIPAVLALALVTTARFFRPTSRPDGLRLHPVPSNDRVVIVHD